MNGPPASDAIEAVPSRTNRPEDVTGRPPAVARPLCSALRMAAVFMRPVPSLWTALENQFMVKNESVEASRLLPAGSCLLSILRKAVIAAGRQSRCAGNKQDEQQNCQPSRSSMLQNSKSAAPSASCSADVFVLRARPQEAGNRPAAGHWPGAAGRGGPRPRAGAGARRRGHGILIQ